MVSSNFVRASLASEDFGSLRAICALRALDRLRLRLGGTQLLAARL